MCNAWNHPPGCSCGWGGDGHLGRRTTFGQGVSLSRSPTVSPGAYRQYFETFVNPNAHCPVCGAPVFFYQSPEGGRVFFDELGPPWPKHPCTSTQASSGKAAVSVSHLAVAKAPAWQAGKWMPVLQARTFHCVEPRDCYQLLGHVNGMEVEFFFSGRWIPPQMTYFVRDADGKATWQIAAMRVTQKGQVERFEFDAFRSKNSLELDRRHRASIQKAT